MAASVIIGAGGIVGISRSGGMPCLRVVDATRLLELDPRMPAIAWGAELLADMVLAQDIDALPDTVRTVSDPAPP